MAIGNTGDPLQANVFRTGDEVAYEDLQGDSASFKENGAGSNPTQEALFDTIAMVDGDDCAAYIIRLIKLSIEYQTDGQVRKDFLKATKEVNELRKALPIEKDQLIQCVAQEIEVHGSCSKEMQTRLDGYQTEVWNLLWPILLTKLD